MMVMIRSYEVMKRKRVFRRNSFSHRHEHPKAMKLLKWYFRWRVSHREQRLTIGLS